MEVDEIMPWVCLLNGKTPALKMTKGLSLPLLEKGYFPGTNMFCVKSAWLALEVMPDRTWNSSSQPPKPSMM